MNKDEQVDSLTRALNSALRLAASRAAITALEEAAILDAWSRALEASQTLADWRADELAAISDLSAQTKMSEMAVLRQALRLYQLHHHRLEAGETVHWSGDKQRAKDFAGLAEADSEPLIDLITGKPIEAWAQEAINRRTTPTRIEAAQPQEAVAWMYDCAETGERKIRGGFERIEQHRIPDSWTEIPLYAAPPQAAESDKIQDKGK